MAYSHASDPEVSVKDIEHMLYNVTWENFRNTIRDFSSGYLDTGSSHFVLIERLGDVTDFYVESASKTVAKLMMDIFVEMERHRGCQLHCFFLKHPEDRSSAGSLLEVAMLLAFSF